MYGIFDAVNVSYDWYLIKVW